MFSKLEGQQRPFQCPKCGHYTPSSFPAHDVHKYQWRVAITRHIGMKIQNFDTAPRAPIVGISAQASPCLFAVVGTISSPVSCRKGSNITPNLIKLFSSNVTQLIMTNKVSLPCRHTYHITSMVQRES